MANKTIGDLINTQTTPYNDTKIETEYDGQSYQMALSTLLPSGLLMPYAGATVPNGWLECDGSAVSRTTYSALFTAIGTTWGSGDGSTTFNLPDFRGLALEGTGSNGSATDAEGNAYTGAALGAVKDDQMQQITGDITGRGLLYTGGGSTVPSGAFYDAGSVSNNNGYSVSSAGRALGFDSADSPNARTGDYTTGPRAGVKYCIKY